MRPTSRDSVGSSRLRAVWAVLLLVSCGSPNAPKAKLEGSLLTVMNLDYDEAILSFSGTEFTVSFRRKKGTSLMGDCVTMPSSCDTTLAVTGRLEQAPFPDGGMDALRGGQTYDLPEILSSGLPRGVVSRNVLDDPRTMFPPIRVGEIHFANIPQQSMNLKAAGDFHVTFENGVEFASGKTVFSTAFQAHFP